MDGLPSSAARQSQGSERNNPAKVESYTVPVRSNIGKRLTKTTVGYDGTQENPQTDNGIINFRHFQWQQR